jgi:hypothetical protein
MTALTTQWGSLGDYPKSWEELVMAGGEFWPSDGDGYGGGEVANLGRVLPSILSIPSVDGCEGGGVEMFTSSWFSSVSVGGCAAPACHEEKEEKEEIAVGGLAVGGRGTDEEVVCKRPGTGKGSGKRSGRRSAREVVCKRPGTGKGSGKLCGRRFGRVYDLRRHEDTVHKVDGEKLHCRLCANGKTFGRSDAWRRHLRTKHSREGGMDKSSDGVGSSNGAKGDGVETVLRTED